MQERLNHLPVVITEKLGEVAATHKAERFCFHIPEEGSEYVHNNMKENEFIKSLIELLQKHGCKMDDILNLFHKYSDNIITENMDNGEFDILIRFEDKPDDPYYYCFKDEGCHIIYHRFLKRIMKIWFLSRQRGQKMLEIRRGTKEDIVQVAAIYDHILTEEEEGRAVIGWIRGVYPTENTAKEAVKNDDLFVMTDAGRIVAAARINQVQVSEYADANWKYQDILPEQVMVLHTLVVDPGQSGKGYGSAFVKFYEDYAKEHNCPYLRMDTNAKNQAARKLYARLGYWEADIVPCVFNGIPGVQLVCLEKTV